MNFFSGLMYNLRGLRLGLKTPKLLGLGFIRFVVMILVTVISASLILVYQEEMFGHIWKMPESWWLSWLWHTVSWLFSLFLIGISTVLSYLASQIFFSVIIMDIMSRVTERKVTGRESQPPRTPLSGQFFHIIKQEIPRTTFPVLLTLLVMIVGWLTPFGPFITLVLTALSVVFLAWDNTDIIPTRLFVPFRTRLGFLLRTFLFHLGFGIWFLIPGLNILFLSFAPVGATLYQIERSKAD
jgi:CysZ protein